MKNLAWLGLLVAGVGCGNGVTSSSGAAACVTATACGIAIVPGGISACTQGVQFVNDPAVANLSKVNAAQINCIAAAGNDCSLARKCLNGGSTPSACTGNSQSCDGSVWKSCDNVNGTNGNSGTRQFDCSTLPGNQMCLVANGNADCGTATCSGVSAQCNGTKLETCFNGIFRETDCARTASTCVPGTLFGAHCRGNGPGCSGNGSLRCDGNVLVTCTDSQEARYDCTQDNLGCWKNYNADGFGCGLGSECSPASYTASCVGTVLKFCNRGKISTVDCGASHFSGCSPDNGGHCTTG